MLFVPLWRDREDAMYVVEPVSSATLHAGVRGRVEAVLVSEGEEVRAGQPLLRMNSPAVDSMRAGATSRTDAARFRAFSAEVRRQSISTAASEQDAAARSAALSNKAQSSLLVVAPTDGVILTADPAALLDQDVATGQPLLSLAKDGSRLVRVFVPVSALDRIPAHAEVALALPGHFSTVHLQLTPMEGDAVPLPSGLVPTQDYKGIVLPTFYCARIPLPASQDDLALGVAGKAKIFGRRRSLFQRLCTVVLNLVRAHIW
jgi:biotin carboxyl carrier protein